MTSLKRFFTGLIAFIFLVEAVNAKELCQPELKLATYSETQAETSSTEKNNVYVYFDGSLSMQGFVKDQPGQKNLYRDVIDDLQQISENVGKKTYFHKLDALRKCFVKKI